LIVYIHLTSNILGAWKARPYKSIFKIMGKLIYPYNPFKIKILNTCQKVNFTHLSFVFLKLLLSNPILPNHAHLL